MARARSKSQKARDARRIADLYLRGNLQADIAEAVGASIATVSRTLKTLQEEWRNSALMDINEAKQRELAKVDTLEREYWDAWVRSQQDAETVIKEKQGKDGEEGKAKVQKKTVGQTGDASFLRGVEWCINKRCELLGLDAPKKLDVTWREEIIALIVSGKVTQEQVKQELGDGLAAELFESAGVSIAKD